MPVPFQREHDTLDYIRLILERGCVRNDPAISFGESWKMEQVSLEFGISVFQPAEWSPVALHRLVEIRLTDAGMH